jgi:hypothetical protein
VIGDDDPTRDGTPVAQIVITRWLDADNEDLITVDRGDCSRLEVLGMLSFAQLSVWNADQRSEEP